MPQVKIFFKRRCFIPDAYALCTLTPPIASALIHEALGHMAESDLILPNYPKTPLIYMPPLSHKITVVDYAHTAFGCSVPMPVYVDDEGTTAIDVPIITSGLVTGAMSNKLAYTKLNWPLTGNARAAGSNCKPLVRMRNTALHPWYDCPAQMLASIKNGYYLVDASEVSGDVNGDFAARVSEGYYVRNGVICERLKDCVIYGNSTHFLLSISMVGYDFEWFVDECTKMRQTVRLASGAPSIRAWLNVGVL